MPAGQKTFTIVPDAATLARMGRDPNAPQSKPPMTSKQAQKLYKQANRGPRLSKAEQRRRDKEEQDRIRNEQRQHEREQRKEQEAERARAARERKKLKEQQLREEKRKNGLPLVNVRPSQDTISRFVRMAPKRTISEAVGEEPEGASDKENEPGGSLEAKRRRTTGQFSQQMGANKALTPVPAEKRATPAGTSSRQEPREDSFSGDDTVADRMASSQLIAEATVATEAWSKNPRSSSTGRPPQTLLPEREKSRKMVAEPADTPTHTAAQKSSQETSATSKRTLQREPARNPSRLVSPYTAPSRPRPAVEAGSPMAPPAFPPRFKTPTSAGVSTRPRFLPRHLQTPAPRSSSRGTLPGEAVSAPSSTQLFVLDYIDELFPSPSQQARELLEDEVSPNPALFFSTQDITLSSQDLRELESTATTPSRVERAQPYPAPSEREVPQPGNHAPEETMPADEHPEGRSPPKKRFFTSSNREATNLVMENLAIAQSRRSFRLEEQAREMKQRHREQEGAKGQSTSATATPGAQGTPTEDFLRTAAESRGGGSLEGQTTGPDDCPPRSPAGAVGVVDPQLPRIESLSQETDYGDIDFEDGEGLDLLDPKSDYLDEDDFWAELL